MKNSILYIAVVFTAGFVHAQQTPKVVVKKQQQSQVLNDAIKGSNFSQIDQVGIGSDAEVFQQGLENASYIHQTGTLGFRNNFAYLLQGEGSENRSDRNYSDFTQNGTGNTIYALQDDDNVLWSSQLGNNNYAAFTQNFPSVDVAPTRFNYIESSQSGSGNYYTIVQGGFNNEAVGTQISSVDAIRGNFASKTQYNYNTNDKRNGHTAITTQHGGENYIEQFQDNKTTSIKGNYGEVNQGDVNGTAVATNVYAEQTQSGTAQEAYIDQMASDNDAFQDQNGRRNTAVVEQNLFGASDLGGNFAAQYQRGDDNFVETVQAGGNNTSLQEQRGMDNHSRTVQEFGLTEGNYVQVIQKGDNLNSFVRQRANGNNSIVDQLGDNHKSVIRQNATGSSLGNAILNGSNSAIVIQRNGDGDLSRQSLGKARSDYSRFYLLP